MMHSGERRMYCTFGTRGLKWTNNIPFQTGRTPVRIKHSIVHFRFSYMHMVSESAVCQANIINVSFYLQVYTTFRK